MFVFHEVKTRGCVQRPDRCFCERPLSYCWLHDRILICEVRTCGDKALRFIFLIVASLGHGEVRCGRYRGRYS